MTEQETPTKAITPQEAERASGWLHALTPYGPTKAVREMTRRIIALDKSKIKLTATEAAHAAQLSISTNLNPFANEIWFWVQKKGDKREFNWMPGRRGIVRQANEQAEKRGTAWNYTDRLLTINEKKERSIDPDDMAVLVTVREDQEMRDWVPAFDALKEALGAEEAARQLPPPGSSGIGIITKEEMRELDKYGKNAMPHYNRAQKRGLTEALKNKYNLQFGFGGAGAPENAYSDYIHEDQIIDGEFEDVETPTGRAEEEWNPKERLDPQYWRGAAEEIVQARLAPDAFYAAEMLAHGTWEPAHVKKRLGDMMEYCRCWNAIQGKDETISLPELGRQAMNAWLDGGATEIDTGKNLEHEAALPGQVIKIKATIDTLADDYAGQDLPGTSPQRKILAAALRTVFDDDTRRYEWSKFYLGAASTKDMTGPYIMAGLRLLGVASFDDEVDPDTAAAILSSHATALKEQGQAEMLLPMPPAGE